MKLRSYQNDLPRFSRGWWISGGKTLFWVIVVTLLIWVYADMEFIVTETMTATVRLTSGEARNTILLTYNDAEKRYEETSYQDVRLVFSARGTRSSLTRMARQIGGPGAPTLYDVAAGREPVPQDVPATEVLKEVLGVEKFGVSLVSVSPTDIKNVCLDRVVEKDVPVSLDLEESNLNPQWQAQTARIAVSEKVWKDLVARTTDAQRVLRTERQSLRNRKPEDKFTLTNVRIVPRVAGLPVKLLTPAATFKVEIPPLPAPETATLDLKVNVQVLTPPTWSGEDMWQKFTFKPATDRTPWTNVPIQVAGPAEDIAKLKGRLDEVQAYLILTQHDMTHNDTPWTREVVVRLPEDLRVKVVGEKPKVSFWVRDRKPG